MELRVFELSKEKRCTITECTHAGGCEYFRRSKLFGMIPAYCAHEGRIVELIEGHREYMDLISPGGRRCAYSEYRIPPWCPLPKPDGDVKK